ncbi:hypothetical protein HOP50_17g80250 [Chloropicon primus]|uniref:PH domain-containing protein n=2 Tax=Chloropicon primus TaxID=1764295 RepID=A0A5B8N0P7_9CHLO|nr:hypothetical protein A3770_17p80030 [Chloropicon primus]UPR04681.1 hypothetical protein HOP50_17g80250 [Chloropicon primus]|eukprot:QDZ25485.1 hypothetical protein A3770_17p80030 [Chloropicon primus]
MEKVDQETIRLVRRLKSLNKSESFQGGQEADAQKDKSSKWNRIRQVTHTPRGEGTAEGTGDGRDGMQEPSGEAERPTGERGIYNALFAPTPSVSSASGGADKDKDKASGPASKEVVFLPHLNLENRFLVSAQTAVHYGGWLLKRGSHMKVWRRRWFTVENECILYRKDPQDFEIKGSIPLCCVRNIFRTDNVKSKAKYENACICIKTDWRTYVVVAETALEARQWNFYLFRLWREVISRARQTVHKVENISSSDLIEETRLRFGGGGGEGEDHEEAIKNDLPAANDTFVAQLKSADATRSMLVQRLWKLAYKLVVLKKNVDFAKDVADLYQKQIDVVTQQRQGDTKTQRRAQETIKLLKKTLHKVNGLYEKEMKEREKQEGRAESLEADLSQAREQIKEKDDMIAGKDKENRQLEEDVLQYQKQVEDYYMNLKKQQEDHIRTSRPWLASTLQQNTPLLQLQRGDPAMNADRERQPRRRSSRQ